MRVSFNQLKEMVDFSYNPAQLAEKLTHIGLEVKKIESVGKLEGVIVGKILDIKKHPNADKLSIVRVSTGREVIPLICGAPNVEQGKYVAVALEGAELPGGVKVKKAKIRGVSSPGMICSEKELGLGEDHSGVMILPSNLSLGDRISHALALEDTILDFEITSNRGDCLSVLGIAREISALTGGKIKFPAYHIEKENTISEKDPPSIQIESSALCPFYAARIIRGVDVAPSPLWLRWKILLFGAKPINNIVDVTNYVMFEIGQPLHPFDLKTITGPEIIVRRAKKGETLLTLDDKERKLSEDMLVIADAKRPIALAGVMGGKETETRQVTQDVLLEAAYFNSVSVGKTSRRLGLISEASSRFERGVDPAVVKKALDRASLLIQKIAGGKVVNPLLEAGKLPLERKKIYFHPSKVNRITGLKLPYSTSEKILKNLGFEVKKNKDRWKVHIPTHRHDVEREIDLVEEVARIYGYNKIGANLPELGAEGGKEDKKERVKSLLREVLVGCGFYETITNPLMGEKVLQIAKESLGNVLTVRNPLSLEQKFLRPHLFSQLVEVASFNYNQEAKNLRLMQMGKIFGKDKKGWKESSSLAGIIVEDSFDFYNLKGIVETIFEKTGVEGVEFCSSHLPYFSGVECALVKRGEDDIGFLGRLHSDVCEKAKLPSQTYIFELNLDLIIFLSSELRKYKPLPRFPSVKRDLSIVIDENIPSEKIKQYISGNSPYVERVEFFDLYQGPHIPQRYKSISFSVIFRHPKRTLTDDEVNTFQSKIIKALENRWKARLRQR